MATFIVFIIIILLVTIFSIQNSMVVGISFLFWRFEASLAIVIFLSTLAGIVIALFFFMWIKMKKSVEKSNTMKKATNSEGHTQNPVIK